MVKIVRHSFSNFSFIIFLLMSYLLTYSSHSIAKGESALSVSHLHLFAIERPILSVLLVLSLICSWRLSRWGKPIIIFYFLSTLVYLYLNFSVSQNKLLLLLLFLNLVHSFLFFLIYDAEIKSAANNPNFFSNQIDLSTCITLEASIYLDQGVFEGKLTNWSPNACFFRLSEDTDLNLSGKAKIVVKYENQEFEGHGFVSSNFGNGVGLRFVGENESVYNWKLLVSILNRKGIIPV